MGMAAKIIGGLFGIGEQKASDMMYPAPAAPQIQALPQTPPPDYATTEQSAQDVQQRQRAAAGLAMGRGSTILSLGSGDDTRTGKRTTLGGA